MAESNATASASVTNSLPVPPSYSLPFPPPQRWFVICTNPTQEDIEQGNVCLEFAAKEFAERHLTKLLKDPETSWKLHVIIYGVEKELTYYKPDEVYALIRR